mmetsp:Transcript_1939/g.2152  ORF Transcript_1939/g.2152 Transcript_1939/m.2152 type:complete len:227 (+) Transcript_1939:101-781(+)
MSASTQVTERNSLLLEADEKPIIVFDLHHVLVKPMYWEMAKVFWNDPHFISNTCFMLCNWCWLYTFITKLIQKKHIEQVVLEYGQTYAPSNRILYNAVIEMANSQRINNGIFTIIRDLKDKDYKIYILSNISGRFMDHLKAKCPAEFNMFDGIHTSTSNGLHYTLKPNHAVFQSFEDTFNVNDSPVIFIDDKVKNVNGARSFGWRAIRYQTPTQLAYDLGTMKVPS